MLRKTEIICENPSVLETNRSWKIKYKEIPREDVPAVRIGAFENMRDRKISLTEETKPSLRVGLCGTKYEKISTILTLSGSENSEL